MVEFPCPICGKPQLHNPRYPNAVCVDCISRAEDAAGRRVQFFNTDLSGGLAGRYVDDGSAYESVQCWIDGQLCQASEAHLGGIVILVGRGTL